MHSLCVVELRVTLYNVKMLSVTQKCFYGKFCVTGNNENYT